MPKKDDKFKLYFLENPKDEKYYSPNISVIWQEICYIFSNILHFFLRVKDINTFQSIFRAQK